MDFEAYSHWLQGYLTPSCLYLIWLLRLPVVVAACSQWSHKYLTSSCLFLICFLRIIVVVAMCSHWLHRYLTPSCMFSICLFREVVEVAAYSQCSQGYLTPLCLFSKCFLSLHVVVAAYVHYLQGYPTPSCLYLIWLYRLPVVVAANSHGYLFFMFIFNMSLEIYSLGCQIITFLTGICLFSQFTFLASLWFRVKRFFWGFDNFTWKIRKKFKFKLFKCSGIQIKIRTSRNLKIIIKSLDGKEHCTAHCKFLSLSYIDFNKNTVIGYQAICGPRNIKGSKEGVMLTVV